MARPRKQGLTYFPFDVDFFSDEKIGAISGEFGIKGDITVVKLLCAIYRNGYFILWDEALKMKLLKDLPGISLELLERIVFRLVKWGFFAQDLFDLVKVLTSRGIQERYFEAIKRRKNESEYPYLLINVCNNPVNTGNNPLHAHTSTQRKEKENKQENSLSGVKENTGSTHRHSMLSTDELRTALLAATDWARCVTEHAYRQTGVQLSEYAVRTAISDYIIKLKAEGVQVKLLEDAKSHFSNWLRIKLEKQKTYELKQTKDNYEQKRLDSERRKCRLMAEFAEADARFLEEMDARSQQPGATGEVSYPIKAGCRL